MSEEHRGALDAIRFCWNARDEQWECMHFKLAAHCATHGTMPLQSTEIGMWATAQRYRKRIGAMRADRVPKLEAIHSWSWEPRESAWREKYAELCARRSMPHHGTPLDGWVRMQRQHRSTLSTDLIAQLDALEFWSWDPLEDAWNKGLAQLRARGSLPSTRSYLGHWVDTQRGNRATMSVGRIAQLHALEFWSWDPREDAWQLCFEQLRERGNMPLARSPLGHWVYTQRKNRATMSADHALQLASLGFWSW
jgi:hypothetical protein